MNVGRVSLGQDGLIDLTQQYLWAAGTEGSSEMEVWAYCLIERDSVLISGPMSWYVSISPSSASLVSLKVRVPTLKAVFEPILFDMACIWSSLKSHD